MSFQTYPKIHAIGKEEVKDIFADPEHLIVIQEKLDGANFRFMIAEDGTIRFGSRTQELEPTQERQFAKNFNRCCQYLSQKLAHSPALLLHKIFYGECISGDTVIRKVGGGKNGKGHSMSIGEMYAYLHSRLPDRLCSPWEKEGMPLLFSLNENSKQIMPNRVKAIMYNGKKELFLMKTRTGNTIKASASHKFFTNNGWKKLSQLLPGDCVAISLLRKEKESRSLGMGHRLVMKSQRDFLLGQGACCECGRESSLELHHIDGNHKNNVIENWSCLCRDCHKTKPVKKSYNRIYDYCFDDILSISSIGIEDCYDLSMDGPPETASYVANNFIVHNCMVKHTMDYDWSAIPPFLLFDVYDITHGLFYDFHEVQQFAQILGVETVPLIWRGQVKDLPGFLQTLK